MKDKRPVNIDFRTIRLPLPAITSILHRISGAFIFVGIALLLYLLDTSLSSDAGFRLVGELMDNLVVKLLTWTVVAGLLYHLVAGIKHLLMDMGIGETLSGSRTGAKLVIAVSAVLIVIAGVWLW